MLLYKEQKVWGGGKRGTFEFPVFFHSPTHQVDFFLEIVVVCKSAGLWGAESTKLRVKPIPFPVCSVRSSLNCSARLADFHLCLFCRNQNVP